MRTLLATLLLLTACDRSIDEGEPEGARCVDAWAAVEDECGGFADLDGAWEYGTSDNAALSTCVSTRRSEAMGLDEMDAQDYAHGLYPDEEGSELYYAMRLTAQCVFLGEGDVDGVACETLTERCGS